MQAESYAYESVDMEATDEADSEENDRISKGVFISNQILKPPKRRRRLPPGNECRTYMWAFWSALVIFCITLLVTLYVLEHKGYHLQSPDSKGEESLRGRIHQKRTPTSWMPSDDVGNEESLESNNLPERDHNNQDDETDSINTRIPIPSPSHIIITANSKIPGVNVQLHGVNGSTTQPSQSQSNSEPMGFNQEETLEIDTGSVSQTDQTNRSKDGGLIDPEDDLLLTNTNGTQPTESSQFFAQNVEEVPILESKNMIPNSENVIDSQGLKTVINVDITLPPQQDIHGDSNAPSESQSTQIDSSVDDDALWKSEQLGGN